MDAPGPPTTFLLLRHGQTAYNVGRRFSGVNDQELTDTGRAQAAAAAARISSWGTPVEAIVTSDLPRAVATATVVAEVMRLPVEVEGGFRETNFGTWEGFTYAEAMQKWPDDVAAWLASSDVAPPGGESFAQTEHRVRQARDAVVARHSGRTVLVVSHVTPIKQLVRIALDAPPVALYRLHVDQASLSELDWHVDGAAVLRRFNDTTHLPTPGT
jgi:probable phosphoglycerate mutase